MNEAPSAATDTPHHSAELLVRQLPIPPCPAIIAQFSAEMNQDTPSLQRLAAIIGKDVALAGTTLATVNSPFYGLARKARNIQDALALLGVRAVANLTAGLLLRKAFPAAPGAPLERLLNEAAALAETAAQIAAHVPVIQRDEAQTYALFRDCGKAVMIAKFTDYTRTLGTHAGRPGADLTVAEDRRYRFNHAMVGHALARGWHLPEPLCKAILFHHDYAAVAAGRRGTEPVNRRLVAFGLLVEQVISIRAGGGLCVDWADNEAFVLASLKLDPEDILALCEAPVEA